MENIIFECPNCKLPIDLSFIVGEEVIAPNPDTCYICHRPLFKRWDLGKRKKPTPSNVNQRKPEVTKQMLEVAKPKKEKVYSGKMKYCECCKKDKPIEDFYLVTVKSGRQAGQSYRKNKCDKCIYEKAKPYIEKSLQKRKEKYKTLSQEQIAEIKLKKREEYKKRIEKNPEYYKLLNAAKAQKPEARIKRRIRNRLADVLSGKKGISFSKSVGCSSKELREHIESKFLSGMTWDNYGYGNGKWVIDHIKPVDLFDKTDSKKLVAANHFSNLQPLWHEMNQTKSNNYDPDHPMGWKGLDALLSEEDKEFLRERFNYFL